MIVRTQRWIAVLDQSTPKAGPEPLLLDRLAASFASMDDDNERSARAVIDTLSAAVGHVTTGRPCVTVAALDRLQRRVVRVGDCHLVIDGTTHPGTNPVDDVLGATRALILDLDDDASLDASPNEDVAHQLDRGREAILPWLIRSTDQLCNHPSSRHGFGAIDGAHVPDRYLEVFALPDRQSEVSLMTDGYPLPRQHLDDAEAALAELLRDDPRMTTIRATKGLAPGADSYDDRAFIRIAIPSLTRAPTTV